jgi:hypothetical protein
MLYDLAENLWSRLPELNRRPSNYESDALPTELSRLSSEREVRVGELHYTNALFVVSSSRTKCGDDHHTEDVRLKFVL